MSRVGDLQRQVSSAPPQDAVGAKSETLTILDNRTGLRYAIPLQNDAVDATLFRAIKSEEGAPLRSFDPGSLNTACCRSAISYINGAEGILRYRGYPIEELATSCTFEEVAYLLIFGQLPDILEAAQFRRHVLKFSHIPSAVTRMVVAFRQDAHPMPILMATFAAMSTCHPEANPCVVGQDIYTRDVPLRCHHIIRALGMASTLAVAVERHRLGRSQPRVREDLSYTENFLHMMDAMGSSGSSSAEGSSFMPHPVLVKALDVLFIIHAEHELNCSTSVMRAIASSNADVYSCIAGAIGALCGPRHGGANEAVVRMLERIGSPRNVSHFLEKVKRREERLMGFGHRIYKSYDPRARIVRRLAEDVFSVIGREKLVEVAEELERQALQDEYFAERKLNPNVDFYSGLIYRAMGFQTDFFPLLFAIPRCAGWLAHWFEFLDDPDNRIMRPQQLYQGHGLRTVVPIGRRPVRTAENAGSRVDRQPDEMSLGPHVFHRASAADRRRFMAV